MVLADLRLTETGDLFFGDDLAIIEGTELVQQNLLKFLRSEPVDVPLNPSMSFGLIDYAGLPNTRSSADIIKNDFLEKVSILEAFAEYTVDVDIFPTDLTELMMEVSILGSEGIAQTIAAPILTQNGFIASIPTTFETNIYDTSRSITVVERVTLLETSDKIRVKYDPDPDDISVYANTAEPDIDEEGNLTDLQTISGTLTLTGVAVSFDEELTELVAKQVDDYIFTVSGTILSEVDEEPDTYEFVVQSEDKYDVVFGVAHPTLGYIVNYEDTVAIATGVAIRDIELPRPEDLLFPYSIENRLYSIELDRFLDAGTYIVQYRASAVA